MEALRIAGLTATINSSGPFPATLTVHQNTINVNSDLPEPDPRWEHVDTNGHYHAYSGEDTNHYPTLTVRTEHVDCDGSCRGLCDGEGYTHDRYHCRICNEEIKPGAMPGPHRHDIPGLKEWSVQVEGYTPDNLATMGDSVSVKLDCEDGPTWFGVALAVEVGLRGSGSSWTDVTVDLVGTDLLGTRGHVAREESIWHVTRVSQIGRL